MATPEAIYVTSDDIITEDATAAHSSGEVVQLACRLIGIYAGLSDAVVGEPAAFKIKGIFEMKKNTTQAVTASAPTAVYWDESENHLVTSAGAGNVYAGQVTKDATASSPTCFVRINAHAQIGQSSPW